jgi:hypothetical protein
LKKKKKREAAMVGYPRDGFRVEDEDVWDERRFYDLKESSSRVYSEFLCEVVGRMFEIVGESTLWVLSGQSGFDPE